MHRWWIVRRAKAKQFRFNIYLHKFLRSDEDRALHDHPWWSISILIKGSISEVNSNGHMRIRKFWPVFRSAEYTHRIVLESEYAWTIFITGRKTNEWGFHCPNGWVPWEVFEANNGCEG